jgi:tetratricopeptide (TPR) repeat protein
MSCKAHISLSVSLLLLLFNSGVLSWAVTQEGPLQPPPSKVRPGAATDQSEFGGNNSKIDALLREAQVSAQAGKTAAALGCLNEFLDILKRAPHTGGQQSGYLRRAREIVTAMNSKGPRSFAADFLLAEILFLESKPADALQVLLPLKPQSQGNPDYFSLLGICYIRTARLEEARQALTEAIALAPNRADLYFQLAGLYQAARNNPAAIEILEKALSKGIRSPEVYFALGLSHFNLGNFTPAMESFERAVDLKPDFNKAYFYIGRSASKLGNQEKAASSFSKAIKLNPSDYLSYFELSLLLLNGGQFTEAANQLQEVIRLNPKYAEAYYQLGKIYSKQSRFSQAIQPLEQAIALNPDLDGAYNELGQIYLRTGDKVKAQQVLSLLSEKKQRRKEQYEKKVSGKEERGLEN